jgi:hypothetical protein
MTAAFRTLYREGTSATAPPPEDVAPTVAYLCHADCPQSGGYFESVGGHTWMRRFAETPGHNATPAAPEDIRDHWDRVVDTNGLTVTPEPEESPIADIIDPRPYQPES